MTHDDAFVMNFSENSNNWYNYVIKWTLSIIKYYTNIK